MLGNRRILKTGIIFGLVGLLASIFNFYSSIWTNSVPFINGHLVDIVILVAVIVGGIYFYKNFLNNGYLHLWQGVILGFWILLVCVNLIALFQYIYLEFINPEMLNIYKQAMKSDLLLKSEELKKQEGFADAQKKLQNFLLSKPNDVVIHQVFLKFFPFPITIFSVIFTSLALRKVEK